MRGRPFQPGNKFGQGRPKGSRNKKSLLLQQMLLNQGEEILETLIKLAKKGDRVALPLAVERLIPRLKDVAELPVEQPRQDSELTTNEHTEKIDPSRLTEDEVRLLEQLLAKAEGFDPGEASSGAPTQEAA